MEVAILVFLDDCLCLYVFVVVCCDGCVSCDGGSGDVCSGGSCGCHCGSDMDKFLKTASVRLATLVFFSCPEQL